jgi:recombination protein RecA
MERTLKSNPPLSTQMKRKVKRPLVEEDEKEYDGDFGTVISTGSTLLDLVISGGRVRGGGLPGGIMVEIFGPNGSGKTVLLCEIAGDIQRKGGKARFDDPEARLNRKFAEMFDLDMSSVIYDRPNTVTEVFKNIRKWKPESKGDINGTFTDSLAALSTNLEMTEELGDKMGQRRAKEFSEGLRKNARILVENNFLMVCSNQIRDSMATYGPKTESPGGKAIGFYSSVRLRANSPEKIWLKKTINGKEEKRAIGVETTFEVFKNSVWKPYRSAPVCIIFDYGVDDIRANLQYIKDNTANKIFMVEDTKLDVSLEKSIKMVEKLKFQGILKEQVIDLWEAIEEKFEQVREKKVR